MYDTLTHMSTALFILSFVSAASAAWIYRTCGLAAYRAMLKHTDGLAAAVRAPDKPVPGPGKERTKEEPAERAREKAPAEQEDKKQPDRHDAGRFRARTVSESDALRKDKDSGPGEEPTERLDTQPEGAPDGATNLQDGSDDTVYLGKNTASGPRKEHDDAQWMPPSGTFRPGSNELIIHTDKKISEIIRSEP